MLNHILKINKAIMISMLLILTSNSHAASSSTRIGLSIEISGTNNCQYSLAISDMEIRDVSRYSVCNLNSVKQQSTAQDLLEKTVITEGFVKLIKTIQ